MKPAIAFLALSLASLGVCASWAFAGLARQDPTLGCLTASESQALFVTWSALPDQASKIVAGINDSRAKLRRGDVAGAKVALAGLEGFSVGHLNALQAWKTQLDLAVITDPVPPEPEPPVDPPTVPPVEPEPPIVIPPEQPPLDGSDPFGAGGAFEWLPESYDFTAYGLGTISIADATEVMPAFPAILTSNQSATLTPFPTASYEGRRFRGVSAWTGWPPPAQNYHGPLWWARDYNSVGLQRNVRAWRIGDFHKGREGHKDYFNVAGDMTLEDVWSIQCGGQAVQFVWRSWETKLPESEWPTADDTITLRRVVAIDCGIINAGEAVRASWPLSIANPGQSVVVENCAVLSNFAQPFDDTSSQQLGPCRSHGALAFYPGGGTAQEQRTPSAIVRNCVFVTAAPDRESIKAHGVDDLLIEACRIETPGRTARIVLYDVPRARIRQCQMDAEIQIRKGTGELVATDHYEPGESWAWGN